MASRICWQCGTMAHHTHIRDAVILQRKNQKTFAYGLLRCDECQAASVAIGVVPNGTNNHPAWASETFNGKGSDLGWLPERGAGKDFPDVPEHIAAAADEAHRCRSINANRAAAALARSVIEATAKDRGHKTGTLERKINEMHTAGDLSELAKETAHEIRFVGNEMAHGDFVVPIEGEDADDVLHFMDEVLNAVYQAPARLNAAREQRLARKAAQKAAAEA
jgi:hypothetical protein